MPVAGVRSLVSSSIIISGGWPCSGGGREFSGGLGGGRGGREEGARRGR